MPDANNAKDASKPSESPLIFISHDSRDAEFAEAFSKLLRSVSAGMLKSFRSSDKKGAEGIEFGDEWYKRLMEKLDVASDVVCLLTDQSLDRPWILYEAGVAKGKLDKPVHGLALGIPLSRVSTGPFYQFQNSDDSAEALAKLVLQLCKRIPGLEPEHDVIQTQVNIFRSSIEQLLKKANTHKKPEVKETSDEGAVAKVLEEMKLMVRELPMRLEHRIDAPDRHKTRRYRRYYPMMIDEISGIFSKQSGDPVWILMIASLVRDDMPWLYEIGLEAYRTAKRGSIRDAQEALLSFRDAAHFSMRGPWSEEIAMGNKEMYMLLRELPEMIDHFTNRYLGERESKAPVKSREAKAKKN